MKATVDWVANETFIGESGSGHTIIMDGNSQDSKAPSPMEMVLMSVGGCSSVDVVSILKKARQQVDGVKVELSAERREEAPRYFTKIHLHFIATGTAINEKHLERAVALSADKYCSVALMLEKAVEITHSFEAVEA
ncbi:OsmC family protein [Psychrobium sp. 1_MG-2023]|uniref:OsmC family protein n=1 Tax=Psychrobium sp. 1_MG-2023 TaxID=3062624 RepID=UPI000C34001D|nr:OsmC family protein [Psychrobium sp. 1_MG-2023]MDP2560989.1 OsmC family protein [Psychrobium sp. 1_MG-2023]PKF58283.1 OsmC family protein [Alteromonadales bacterium alter-6D02]